MAQTREKLNAIIKKNLSQSIGLVVMARGNVIPIKIDTANVGIKKFFCFLI